MVPNTAEMDWQEWRAEHGRNGEWKPTEGNWAKSEYKPLTKKKEMSFFNFLKRESVTDNADKVPAVGRGGSFASHAVTVGSASSALNVSSWYRASEVLANTMGQLVLEYQKKNDAAHGNHYEQDMRGETARRLNYLFGMQPNPQMTAQQFWAQMTLHRLNDGNAVAWIERDSMQDVKAVWLCHTASLNPTTMTYTLTLNKNGAMTCLSDVDADDVIHWRNTFSADHGLTGIGTLKYAAQALSIAATNDRQAKDIAAKGGKHKILLSEKEQPGGMDVLNILNKDQKKKQQDELQQALDESKDVLLMSGMMSAQVISQDAQAQQLLESRKFDITAIARYTGVPLVLLMDYSNNTYKAPEQAMQAFLQHTISPMANSLEMEINTKILGFEGWPAHRFQFIEESLMRLDPMGRANLGKILLETGVKCVNELRAENDLPAVEGGDEHFISTNLQSLKNPTVGAKTLEPGNYTVQGDEGQKGDEE